MPKRKEATEKPLGSPAADAAETFATGIVSVVPVIGPVLSSSIAAGLQARTTRKLNKFLSRIEDDIREARRSPDELIEDPAFRGGIAQLLLAAFRQEEESKLGRIRNFLRHRISNSGSGGITVEAVLRAFEHLPSEHIEAFLALVARSEDDLRDFSMIEGNERFTASNIVKSEFPSLEKQDHCWSPADARYRELSVLFTSLQGAGLVREIPVVDGPGYETTALAKHFVAHCLPPPSEATAKSGSA